MKRTLSLSVAILGAMILWFFLLVGFFFIFSIIFILFGATESSTALIIVICLLDFLVSTWLVCKLSVFLKHKFNISFTQNVTIDEPPPFQNHVGTSSDDSTQSFIYCRHCGSPNAPSSKYCTNCGKPNAPTSAKKHPKSSLLAACGVGIICLVAVFFSILLSLAFPSKDSPRITSTVSETNPTHTPTVGDTIKLGNVLVTLDDVKEIHGSQFVSPDEGNVFVLCEFTIENNTNSEIAVSSLLSFKCYFDDFTTPVSLSAIMAENSRNQLDGSVDPGKKINGVVGFEASEDWAEMEIHYMPSFSSRKSFVFNYRK